MLIDQFHTKMCRRFKNNLKKDADIKYFDDWCHEKLKPWQGEILGFVFHEFDETVRTNSHPNHAVILDMCKVKSNEQHKKNYQSGSGHQGPSADELVEQFKSSLEYGPCCVRFIAGSVISFIEKHKKIPNEYDFKKMERTRDEFLDRCRKIKSGEMQDPLNFYQVCCGLYLKDVALIREHFQLNPIPKDYRHPTFKEHENRDMDFPVYDQTAIGYDSEIPMEQIGN